MATADPSVETSRGYSRYALAMLAGGAVGSMVAYAGGGWLNEWLGGRSRLTDLRAKEA